MKQYKVQPVDNLNALVAFRPAVIEVPSYLYDKVENKAEFEIVVNQAREEYERNVANAKSSGVKVSPAKLKSEAVALFIEPFLKDHNLLSVEKVTIVKSNQKDLNLGTPKIRITRDVVVNKVEETDEVLSDMFDKELPDKPTVAPITYEDDENLFLTDGEIIESPIDGTSTTEDGKMFSGIEDFDDIDFASL